MREIVMVNMPNKILSRSGYRRDFNCKVGFFCNLLTYLLYLYNNCTEKDIIIPLPTHPTPKLKGVGFKDPHKKDPPFFEDLQKLHQPHPVIRFLEKSHDSLHFMRSQDFEDLQIPPSTNKHGKILFK